MRNIALSPPSARIGVGTKFKKPETHAFKLENAR